MEVPIEEYDAWDEKAGKEGLVFGNADVEPPRVQWKRRGERRFKIYRGES